MNNVFKKGFDNFACIGDTITAQTGPYTLIARIEPDTDTRVTDTDWATPEQVAAWKRDEWFYCGIVLAVKIDDVMLDDHAASLWGVECNLSPDNGAYLTEIANELAAEALTEAQRIVAKIKGAA